MTCLKSISKFFLKKKSYFTVNKSEFWFCEWGFTNSHKNKKNLIFVVPKLKFLIHASKYSFPCQILLFYYFIIIIIIIIIIAWFLILNFYFCMRLWLLCIYAMLWQDWIFLRREGEVVAVTPLESSDWSEIFLKMVTTFFGKEKILLGSPQLYIKKKKWKIMVGYNFLENDIHKGVLRKEDSL